MSGTFKYKTVEHDGFAVSMCEGSCWDGHLRKQLSITVFGDWNVPEGLPIYKTIAFNELSILAYVFLIVFFLLWDSIPSCLHYKPNMRMIHSPSVFDLLSVSKPIDVFLIKFMIGN